MAEMKKTMRYVFTVEGETEMWYLDWLKDSINANPDARYNTKIERKVQQSPKKYAKRVNPLTTEKITHLFDYEGSTPGDIKKFKNVLSEIKEANSFFGKALCYSPCYCNLTFELWIVLHKQSCNGSLANRTQYLPIINKCFQENFESLAQYKEEKNFKRCLSKLTLQDVRNAITRSKLIMQRNRENRELQLEYMGLRYYPHNPSLTLWQAIDEILTDSGA